MIVAYLRVSTSKQNLSNQQDEIRRFAQNRNLSIDRWVMEVVSGKKNKKERKLGSMLKRLKKGDTLIVTELSRLSRTLTDIMAIMGHCLEKTSLCTAPRTATPSTTASTAKSCALLSDWWPKSNAT